MRRPSLAFLFLLLVTCLVACVKTGSVTVKQAMKPIPNEKTVAVTVKNPNPDWQKDADNLRDGLMGAFKDKKWWQSGPTPDATFEITLTAFDKGNKAERMFAGTGEAELQAEVVVKSSGGDTLGAFAVTGNSKRQSHTRIGGYDTSWGDSLPGRAVEATIDQIVDYLEQNR
jgi:Domain of unknown function (DUF4410)